MGLEELSRRGVFPAQSYGGIFRTIARAWDGVLLETGRNLAAAKQDERKYRGKKPSYDRQTLSLVVDMLGRDAGASEIAKATGLTRQTVLRIRSDTAGAEQALVRWGM